MSCACFLYPKNDGEMNMLETNKMFLTADRLMERVQELAKYRFVDMETIVPLSAMPGTLGENQVYHTLPEHFEGQPLNLGDEYRGLDKYLWVRKTIRLPEHRDGYECYGLFNFGRTGDALLSGFESLLYVNGKPYQGVDTFHNDVNFESLAGETVEVTFLLWTGLQGGGPKREMRHQVRQADVGYLHTATDELYYLTRAAAETIRRLEDGNLVKHLLTKALERVFQQINWDADGFYATVDAALAGFQADIDAIGKDSRVTVNVVGHTHIDVAWLWRLKHSREKAQRSFSTVLRLMDEFDEYTFLQTQPQLYHYIQQDNPELFSQMRQRIAQGRWEADGGMWLEADCNISSGEALTRQFLYGMRYFQKEFGKRCEYLWLPDVFGYSWALPQILKGVGIDTFMTTKISWNQFNSMPHDLFRWRGIDGSEVMTYFVSTPEVDAPYDQRMATYNGQMNPHTVIGSWEKFHDKDLSDQTLICFGHGDGGGGVNRDMLKMRRAMDKMPGLPAVKPTRAGEFFRYLHQRMDAAEQYVPVWDGELYLEYHRGTYTSQGWNKLMNRRLEFALAESEWLSAQSMLAGGTYDQDTLLTCWRTILRNQFHDIIPGSSIHEVYEDSRVEYTQAEKALQGLQSGALSTLAQSRQDCYTLWNFTSFPRQDSVWVAEKREGRFVAADGTRLPAQREQEGYWVQVQLDALGVTTIRFEEAPAVASASPFVLDLDAGTIETPCYLAAWNQQGQLTRLFDREANREVLPRGQRANVLEMYEDKPLKFDNWDVDLFHLMKHEEVAADGAPVLVESGALRLTLRFPYHYHHSSFQQDVTFYTNSRRIDFATHADWHEDHRLLKAAFPVDIRATNATYDIQYGHVERPTHFNTSWDYARFEVVAHKWADMSEADYGVSLLNNCKYGHSTHNNVMRVTLLKSGKFPDTQADMGQHSFTYALLPHSGNLVQGNTIEEANFLNLPLRTAAHTQWNAAPLFTWQNRNIQVDAIKKAEDGRSLILRLHECRGTHTTAKLHPSFAMNSVTPCNLLEEPTGEPQQCQALQVSLRPFEIQTFRIDWEQA